MALVTLVEIVARDPANAAPVIVRIAGGGSRAYTHRGVTDWLAGLKAPPVFTNMIGFDDDGWTARATPTSTAIAFAPSSISRASRLAALAWNDASVSIWSGDDRNGEPVWGNPTLTGTIEGYAYQEGVFQFTVADLAGPLNKEVLTSRFTGKGGVEGGEYAEGRIKRRSWGRVANVEAGLLYEPTNRYEVGDPAFPLQDIVVVRDRGSVGERTFLADAGSPAATVAALDAAVVPEGGAVVAPSIAQFRWWTKPAGPLTVDLRGEVGAGYVETAPVIAARLSAAMNGPAIVNLDAAIALRGAPAGLHVEGTETGAAALSRLLGGVSLAWVLVPGGTIDLRPFTFENPVETLRLVAEPEREREFRPLRSRRLGYAKNHRVQNDGEITASVLASDVIYDDGQTGEDWRPAEMAADVTKSLDLSDTVISLSTDASGAIVAGQLPASIKATRRRGGVDVSASTIFSIVITGTITATIDNDPNSIARGTVTITGVQSSGTIQIVSELGGASLPATVAVNLPDASAPPPTADSASLTTFPKIKSRTPTYPAEPTGFVSAKADTAGKISMLLDVTYYWSNEGSPAFAYGSLTGATRLVFRPAGSASWTDATGEIVGTEAYRQGNTDTGKVDVVGGRLSTGYVVVSGLTPGATYEAGALLRALPVGSTSKGQGDPAGAFTVRSGG